MTNEAIFTNKNDGIPYSNTNLEKDYFTFSTRKPIYWLTEATMELLDGKHVIKVKVIEYDCKSIEQFNRQVRKEPIPFMIFEKLDYDQFIPQCGSYKPNKLKDLFANYPIQQPIESSDPSQSPIINSSEKLHNQLPASKLIEPIVKELQLEFRFKFSDSIIVDGGVQFTKFIDETNCQISFTIVNPALKQHYNSIKEYFAKKLGKKTFSVLATIKQVDWKIITAIAYSK